MQDILWLSIFLSYFKLTLKYILKTHLYLHFSGSYNIIIIYIISKVFLIFLIKFVLVKKIRVDLEEYETNA